MGIFSRRSLLALSLLSLSLMSTAYAQTHDDEAHIVGGICGSDLMSNLDVDAALANTARLDPATYRAIMAAAKDGGARTMSSQGAVARDFINYDYTKNAFQNTRGVLRLTGRTFRLWIDVNDTARITSEIVAQLALALDSATGEKSRNTAQGIVDNDHDVFGLPPVNKFSGDNLTDFLMLDIQDGIQSGGNILGFFSPTDQIDPTIQPISNGMNLLYIDSREGLEGGIRRLLSTIAHEYQHLIHYARKKSSLSFFNEGCSEVASILNGYLDRRDDLYVKNTNVNFFRWTYDKSIPENILADYTRAMTWTHYLGEQYGEQFLYELAGAKSDSMARVNEALTKIGRQDVTWRETFKSFAVANYVQTNVNDPRYGFKTKLVSSRPKSTNYSGNNFLSSELISLEPFGMAYYIYTQPGALRLRFSADKEFAVMAMIWKETTAGAPTEVRELSPGTEYTMADDNGMTYRRVVIAVINMQARKQAVIWTANALTVSGVADNESLERGLGFASVAPNPLQSEATIRFRTASTDPVFLRVYDVQGGLVGTLIDGASYEAGEHEIRFNAATLPNGHYVARLTQGERSIGRSVVVVK